MFSGIVSVIPWKDHFIQFILQIVVLIFYAKKIIQNKIKKKLPQFATLASVVNRNNVRKIIFMS